MAEVTCADCGRAGLKMRRGRCGTCVRRRPHATPKCVGCGADVTPTRGQRHGTERCPNCRLLRDREIKREGVNRMMADPVRAAEHRRRRSISEHKWKTSDRGRFLNYASNYRRNSGISVTWDEMAALMVQQGDRCAICRKPIEIMPGRGTVANAHLDHCHRTMRIRGWLCSPCNRALGMLRDDPAVLRAAADYLERAIDSVQSVSRGELQA